MFKVGCAPSSVDDFFRSLASEFHWNHADYFRDAVLAMALSEGRHTVSNLVRHLDAEHHRSRYNNFLNVARWEPESLLHQAAVGLLQGIDPPRDKTLYLILDDTVIPKRGRKMEAVGWLHDSTRGGKVRGHDLVFSVLRAGDVTIPWGFRPYVKKQDAPKLGRPFRKVTELGADLIRSFDAPDGWDVVVLFDTFYLCQRVVNACREKGFAWVSCLKSNRVLHRGGRKLKAGQYVKHALSGKSTLRRQTVHHRQTTYETADAGWLDLSHIGYVHLVCSRRKGERRCLGLVTESKELSVSAMVRGYAERWWIEQFFKDGKQRLGLGQYQNGSMRADVNHTYLVCFAYALLTHLSRRGREHGEKGKARSRAAQRASLSVGSMQNALRRRTFLATIADVERRCPSGDSFVKELKRLLVA
jgi:SRSO17 transposase